MREIRPSGSEGGEAEPIGLPYPYQNGPPVPPTVDGSATV